MVAHAHVHGQDHRQGCGDDSDYDREARSDSGQVSDDDDLQDKRVGDTDEASNDWYPYQGLEEPW